MSVVEMEDKPEKGFSDSMEEGIEEGLIVTEAIEEDIEKAIEYSSVEPEAKPEGIPEGILDTVLVEGKEHSAKAGKTSDDSDSAEEDKFAATPKSERVVKKRSKPPPSFFKLIGRIPNIDQISWSGSEQIDAFDISDDGEEEQYYEHDKVAAIVETPSEEFSDYDYDLDLDSSKEDDDKFLMISKKATVSDENLFEATVEKEGSQLVGFKQIVEFDEIMKYRNAIAADVDEFLGNLFDAIVEGVEYRDAKKGIQKKFDKKMLFKKLVDALEDLRIEQKVSIFVHSKCVLYYRRQKVYRPILPEESETHLKAAFEKYETAMVDLYCLKGTEDVSNKLIANKIKKDEELAASLEEKLENEIEDLEDLMKMTFRRRGSKNLDLSVERKIKEMSNLRKEVSMEREKFIKVQHALSALLKKKGDKENISETVRYSDIENLLDENALLWAKVQEKKVCLDAVHRRFISETHAIAHVKEQQCMALNKMKEQMKAHTEAELKIQELRRHVCDVKTHGIQLKKQLYEEGFKYGLMNRPALLDDFDKDIERAEELKAKVDALRDEKAKIEKKIKYIEEVYAEPKPFPCDFKKCLKPS